MRTTEPEARSGAEHAPPGSTPRRSPWATLTVLAIAQFMVVLDVTIVNVALPDIQASLHFSPDDLQWVISAYTLAFGGFLLLGGRVSDLLGRRRIFSAGLALFSVASLAGGLATTQGVLIGVRAVQGFGGALMSAAALSILTVTFAHGRERNTAMGIWGGLAGLGGTLGVVAGGILVDQLGWEWVFFVNVPIGVLCSCSPPDLRARQPGRQRRPPDLRHRRFGARHGRRARGDLRCDPRRVARLGLVEVLVSLAGGCRAARRVRRRRGPLGRPAGAAAAVPLRGPEQGHGRPRAQRRGLPRDVLPDGDLPAAGPRALGARDRPGVPADGLRRDRRRRSSPRSCSRGSAPARCTRRPRP